MTRRALWLVLVGALASAAAWTGAAELETPARLLTAILVGALPMLLAAQGVLDPDLLKNTPVETAYVSSMMLIWTIGGAAFWAGTASGFTPADMGLGRTGATTVALWTGIATVAAVAVGLLGRLAGWRESDILEWMLPESARERALFVLLSISAGIGEEIAYRGFLIPALERASGSVVLAVAVSSIAFGMMHGYQQTVGAMRASLLGALLAVPFVVTGSVLPSMLAHAFYDVLAGVLLTDWFVPGRNRPRRPARRQH